MKKYLAALLVLGASLALAQTPPAPAPLNHDFDFWIGDWNVTTPDGKPAGANRIDSVADGRALLENWAGDAAAGGCNGKSLNCYNATKKQWQQFWIGSGGGVLELAGGLVNGSMVLASAETKMRDGRALTNRITWTPGADGSVRQLWEQSFDSGKTWTVSFDGCYRKKK